MDITRYITALDLKFKDVAQKWPDIKPHASDISNAFQSLVNLFCDPDTAAFQAAFKQASDAYSRMLRSYSGDAPAYRQLFDKGYAHLLDQGRNHFFDQCRDFLTAMHRARMMGLPTLATAPRDLPAGDVLMYRAITFLKGFHVADDGQILDWTLRNQSDNERVVRAEGSGIGIFSSNGTPTSNVLFAVRKDQDLLLIAPFGGDPLVLHFLVCGPSAGLLRQARTAIAEGGMSRFPLQEPVTPEGKDDYFAVHHDHRRRGGKRFNPPTLLAIAANRYWKFTRALRVADIVRKLPKSAPSHAAGFDFKALCREPFEVRSCIALGGYVSLYHLHLTQLEQDVFALEGFGRIFMIGEDFCFGDIARFKEKLTPYLAHISGDNAACEARVFYQIAKAFFNGAPATQEARGLALGYGNWRVGDCSFALTSIRQMSDLGYEVDVLNQDSELLGFDPATANDLPHVRALFGEAAMKRICFNADYMDGMTHLLSGSLGMAPRMRFPFQSRGRSYGNLWQKTMFAEFDGKRRDLILGWPAVRRDASRPFGVFFTLDLEKRRWLEQEEFLEKLLAWANDLPVRVNIFLNGMTGYRHAHLINADTLKIFLHEENVVAKFRGQAEKRYRNTALISMAELSLSEKCEIIYEKIDYCIGPLGSGTVVPSVLFSKPSLIYSSHGMYNISRDRYKNLELLIGPYSELVPLGWSKDEDSRNHNIFPEDEMTNYSISSDSVFELAKNQISYHLLKTS